MRFKQDFQRIHRSNPWPFSKFSKLQQNQLPTIPDSHLSQCKRKSRLENDCKGQERELNEMLQWTLWSMVRHQGSQLLFILTRSGSWFLLVIFEILVLITKATSIRWRQRTSVKQLSEPRGTWQNSVFENLHQLTSTERELAAIPMIIPNHFHIGCRSRSGTMLLSTWAPAPPRHSNAQWVAKEDSAYVIV